MLVIDLKKQGTERLKLTITILSQHALWPLRWICSEMASNDSTEGIHHVNTGRI